MKRREIYAAYRTPPPPARVVAGCLAFALVVGSLFAAQGRLLGITCAGVVVGFFLVVAPAVDRAVPPGAGTFWHASFLLSICTAERFFWRDPALFGLFGICTLIFLVLGVLYYRPPGRGGVIR